jgi:hypothetical protein
MKMVSKLSLDTNDLYRSRRAAVLRTIAPLIDRSKVLIIPLQNVTTKHILIAQPRATGSRLPLNADDARVRSKSPDVTINYYEQWTPDEAAPSMYNLDRIYLHLFLKYELQEVQWRQVLCLHCDVDLKNTDPHYRYKRGPHLHIIGADPRIDRAHISVVLHDEKLGGETVEELTSSIANAISMIEKEILPCFVR